MVVRVALLAALGVPALTRGAEQFKADLLGFEEVPSISSAGSGEALAEINDAKTSIAYELSYEGLEGTVTQAHIHFGQRSVNGGISVYFCTNLGNGPVGTPACPAPPTTIIGSINAANVIGPAGQGINAAQFDRLLSAISSGVTYVNVHTDKYPGGEIRGQLAPVVARAAGTEPWLPGALLSSWPLWVVMIAAAAAIGKRKASRQAGP
jgi:hypothetical protein